MSDWSSDVCSSDLSDPAGASVTAAGTFVGRAPVNVALVPGRETEVSATLPGYKPATHTLSLASGARETWQPKLEPIVGDVRVTATPADAELLVAGTRSEEHTSELQSLMRISYAVFCLKKQNILY